MRAGAPILPRPAAPGHDGLAWHPPAVLLVVALAFGGGGASHPVAATLIETVAVIALAWSVGGARAEPMTHRRCVPLYLLLAFAATHLIQLVPLPSAVWRGLPGREWSTTIRDTLGAGTGAYPLSLDPAATLRMLTGLIPAAAMLWMVPRLACAQRTMLARLAIGVALVSLALGAVQFLTAGAAGTLYPEGHVGNATGLFANRNHQATLLLLALALAPAVTSRTPAGLAAAAGLVAVFAAGVIATTSRAGLLLLPLASLPLLLRLSGRRRWWEWAGLALAIAGAIAGAVVVAEARGGMVRVVLDRLRTGNLVRMQFWQDSWPAVIAYWPFGTGYGTFAAIFRSVEPIGHLGPNYVNHAHNELIELALEGGLPAVLVAAAAVCCWLAAAWSIAGRSRTERPLAISGWAGTGVLFLHALVDYPVRLLPIAVIGAMLAAFLTPAAMLPRGTRRAISGNAPSCA